jgi:hypothetical protein
MKSDKVIFKNVLNACANLAVLDKGKQVHACIVKAALESLVFVENAFVDMSRSPKVCKMCIKHLTTFLCVI